MEDEDKEEWGFTGASLLPHGAPLVPQWVLAGALTGISQEASLGPHCAPHCAGPPLPSSPPLYPPLANEDGGPPAATAMIVER